MSLDLGILCIHQEILLLLITSRNKYIVCALSIKRVRHFLFGIIAKYSNYFYWRHYNEVMKLFINAKTMHSFYIDIFEILAL